MTIGNEIKIYEVSVGKSLWIKRTNQISKVLYHFPTHEDNRYFVDIIYGNNKYIRILNINDIDFLENYMILSVKKDLIEWRNKKMSNTKKIAFFGIGIALYFVLGMIMNIPLLAGTHLQTDLGYVAFGAFLYLFGWQACIVGIIGCLFESLLTSGWVPVGWMVGQLFIGVVCGIVYKKTQRKWLWIITTIVAVFIGVALIKTGIECALYFIPFMVKFVKNFVAFIADVIPMLFGLWLGTVIENRMGDKL